MFVHSFLYPLSASRVSHSARVNIYGLPFIREMPKITGISGTDLVVKCPVAGYPIDKVHWERGTWHLLNIDLMSVCFIPKHNSY